MSLDTQTQVDNAPSDANRNGEQRPERGGRSPRGERRPPRGPRPETRNPDAVPTNDLPEQATNLGELNSAPTEPTEQNDAPPREKRSRDRYGRDRKARGERTDRAPGDASSVEDTQGQPASETGPADGMDEAPRKSYFSVPAATAVVNEAPVPAPATDAVPAETPTTPAPEVALVVAAPLQTPAPLVAQAPLVVDSPTVAQLPAVTQPAPAVGMPKVNTFVLPMQALAQIAEQAGLNWVNSDAQKVAAVQAAIAAEPQPTHVPRARPAMAVADERPLVLVETKKDLREVTLPFEDTVPL